MAEENNFDFSSKVWEDHEIQEGLRQLPHLMHKQAQEVVEAEAALKGIKHVHDLAEAAAKLAHIQMHKDLPMTHQPSPTELNAVAANATKEVYEEVLAADRTHALEKARMDYLKNTFDSIRKDASLKIEEIRSLNGTVARRPYEQNR